jgi:nucleoside-diphosphate-sugar epimerase
MTTKEYLHKNEEITTLPKLAIAEKKLFSFINLSSGVARDLDGETTPKLIDEYSKLKKRLEVEYLESCNQSGVAFVNCRIFSLTGRHINEFKNLALSSFIIQARDRNQIEVKSPSTKRTYVDATILAGTLLTVATLRKNANFDSGGQLVTMLELAKKVLSVLGKDQSAIITGNDQSPDYFGNFEKFNSMALKIDENFLGIEDQILKTLSAFN